MKTYQKRTSKLEAVKIEGKSFGAEFIPSNLFDHRPEWLVQAIAEGRLKMLKNVHERKSEYTVISSSLSVQTKPDPDPVMVVQMDWQLDGKEIGTYGDYITYDPRGRIIEIVKGDDFWRNYEEYKK